MRRGWKAAGKVIVLNWNIIEKGEKYVLNLENSALTYLGPSKQSAAAEATVKMTRATFDAINTGQLTWQAAIASGAVQVEGNSVKLFDLLGNDDGERRGSR